MIEKYFIPKGYKEKYSDNVAERKYASGYWFQFVLPRCIVPQIKLYRWLNFFHSFAKRVKVGKKK